MRREFAWALGFRMRTIRETKGLDQKQCAEQLEISQSAYSRWETGAADMTVMQLLEWCEFAGCQISDVVPSIREREEP
jgi:transcriptional regulator with XRE-family HTH domain